MNAVHVTLQLVLSRKPVLTTTLAVEEWTWILLGVPAVLCSRVTKKIWITLEGVATLFLKTSVKTTARRLIVGPFMCDDVAGP